MAKKKDDKKTEQSKKPSKAVHLSPLDGDPSSMKVLRLAAAEFDKKEVKRNKKKKLTPAQLEAQRKRNRARVLAYEQRLKEKLKAKKQVVKAEVKDLQETLRTITKGNKNVKQENNEIESAEAQTSRLKTMIARSLAERNKETGAHDPEWQAELAKRDAKRLATHRSRQKAIRAGRIPAVDPYANAASEMQGLHEGVEDFEPSIQRTNTGPANLAGAGTARDQAERVAEAIKKAGEQPQAQRADKTSSTSSLGDDKKKKAAGGGTSTKADDKKTTGAAKAEKKVETQIDTAKAATVAVAPAVNQPLFASLVSIQEAIAASQERIADYMDRAATHAARDRTDQKLEKEQQETYWSQLLKNTAFDPEMEKKGRKLSDDVNGFLGKFLSGRMITALKVLGALAGGASLFNVGRKLMHRGKGVGLSLQSMLARATGNKEWLSQIEGEQAEHAQSDPGSIGPIEGVLAGLTALFVGNKVRKGVKLVSTVGRNGWNLGKKALGMGAGRAAAGGARAAAGAGAGIAGAAGRGALKGILARNAARFAMGQAVGSAVPGVGNTIMAVAMAIWTIGDIAWALMSDETKDKIKDALGSAWEATKDVCSAMGDKIMEWGRKAIGYIKDIWNGQELGTNFNTSSASAAASRNREAGGERAIGEQGVRMTKAEAHRQAIANDPTYAAAIKKERTDAESQGKHWTFDTSKAFNDMMSKNLSAPSGYGDAIAMSGAEGGAGRLLDLIAKGESKSGAFGTSGYDAVWGGAAKYDAEPKKPLSQMTLGEVLAWQKELINKQKAAGVPADSRSSAAGRYQFVNSTLEPLLAKLKIPHSAKFDAAMQDKLALALMDETGKGWSAFQSGKIDASTLANTVASKWASFKNTSGQGVYNKAGFNHASISANEVINAVSLPKPIADPDDLANVVPATATPQANIPLPDNSARVEPTYVPKDTGRGDISKNYDMQGNPLSAVMPPQPVGKDNVPGLFRHSFVEDGALQIINIMGMS